VSWLHAARAQSDEIVYVLCAVDRGMGGYETP
jgi:hypothetical protein